MANLRTNNLSGEQGQNAIRGSVFFDGFGDKLSVPNSADVRLGSNDFTMEAWVKFGDVQGTWDTILGMYDEGNDRRAYHLVRYRNAGAAEDGRLYMYVNTDGTSGGYANVSGGFLSINDWHHVAGVRDGNTLRVYINGVQVGSSSFSGTIYNNTTDPLFIGDVESDDTKIMNGFISNVRLINGTCIYPNGTTFTPPQHELTLVPNTVLLACQNSDDVTQEATGKTITAAGNLTDAAYVRMQPKVIPPYGVDAGNTFGGTIQQSSQGYMYFPTGRTEERGRGRGLIVANYIQPANYNTCEFITIQSMGNSIDFGDAAAAVRGQATLASSTRAVSGSGYVAPSVTKAMEFFTIATRGNSTSFGTIQGPGGDYTPISNETRGIFAGGYAYPNMFNAIDFITIASTGDSTDFGDMTTNRANGNRSAVNSSTRGLIGGGYISPTGTNNIEFLTIATTGNSSDFGDLTSGRGNFTGLCSSTRGVFAGGSNPNNNIIDFVTIASAGNASDFGDMFTGNTVASCSTSNKIRGVIIGGDLQPSNAFTNTMQHVTIATTGNTQDFGDMLTTGAYRNATSDSHGGLS